MCCVRCVCVCLRMLVCCEAQKFSAHNIFHPQIISNVHWSRQRRNSSSSTSTTAAVAAATACKSALFMRTAHKDVSQHAVKKPKRRRRIVFESARSLCVSARTLHIEHANLLRCARAVVRTARVRFCSNATGKVGACETDLKIKPLPAQFDYDPVH